MPKNSKLDYPFFTGIVCGIVLAVLWMDNAAVTILTMLHQITGREATRVQNRKWPRESSSNTTKVKQPYGPDEFEKELPIPTCIVDYNHTMNGIDIADQYRAYYTAQLITVKTWMPLFFWTLDAALVNAFIIYRDIAGKSKVAHKDFHLDVA